MGTMSIVRTIGNLIWGLIMYEVNKNQSEFQNYKIYNKKLLKCAFAF